eukprot:m51a1_g10332 hypothetical protein (553) ;mRNA; f:99712-101983
MAAVAECESAASLLDLLPHCLAVDCVLSQLPPRCLLSLRACSRRCRSLADDARLWRSLRLRSRSSASPPPAATLDRLAASPHARHVWSLRARVAAGAVPSDADGCRVSGPCAARLLAAAPLLASLDVDAVLEPAAIEALGSPAAAGLVRLRFYVSGAEFRRPLQRLVSARGSVLRGLRVLGTADVYSASASQVVCAGLISASRASPTGALPSLEDLELPHADEASLTRLLSLRPRCPSVVVVASAGVAAAAAAGAAEAGAERRVEMSAVLVDCDALRGLRGLRRLRSAHPAAANEAADSGALPRELEQLAVERLPDYSCFHSGAEFEALSPRVLAAVPELQGLELTEVALTEDLASAVASLRSLRRLSLRACRLTPASVAALARSEARLDRLCVEDDLRGVRHLLRAPLCSRLRRADVREGPDGDASLGTDPEVLAQLLAALLASCGATLAGLSLRVASLRASDCAELLPGLAGLRRLDVQDLVLPQLAMAGARFTRFLGGLEAFSIRSVVPTQAAAEVAALRAACARLGFRCACDKLSRATLALLMYSREN